MTENTSQKKVSRTTAIAVLIVCVLLAAGFVSVIAIYSPMVSNLESQIMEQENEIADLNSQISSLNSNVSHLRANLAQNESYITDLEETIAILNSRLEGYFNIVYLNASSYLLQPEILTQDANSSTRLVLYQEILDFAGFLIVDVESTSNTTYAQLIYNSFGVNYNQNVTVGTGGIAYFPILPGEVEIRICNLEPTDSDPVTATIYVIYRY